MRRLLISAAAAAAIFAAAALAGVLRPDPAHGSDDPRRDLVTTLGVGTVTTVPDVATIVAGGRTDAPSAAEALRENATQMERVLAALRKAGAANLQTQEVSLYPREEEDGGTKGFVARSSVSARTKIADAGALVDAAVAAGANDVSGPLLERSDRDALYRDALAKALEDARAKARALAEAGGFDVGRVVVVTEEGADAEPAFDSGVRLAAAQTAIEPGTQKVEARVSVSFEIG